MKLLIFMLSSAAMAAPLHLMPMPQHVTLGEGRLIVDGAFGVATDGCTDTRVPAAADRLRSRLSKATGIPMPPNGHATLKIDCSVMQPVDDESYTLTVTTAGATIVAKTALGAMHGMETFLQLPAMDAEGFFVPAVTIVDKPRFAWRGLMIDAGRHFMPVPVIERNLDAMAAVKFNVFHWHLSEDQGFRAESKLFPKLTGMGSDGAFYTQDEMRGIVAYARDRGIRVIPEFDMPGHSTSWFVGYPELASGPGPYKIERKWGIFDVAMDPTREEVYQFLDAFIGEMTGIFPDEYFHIGGDEVTPVQWERNAAIRAFEREHGLKDAHGLQSYFNQRLQTILAKHHRKMMGWDEILQPGLSNQIMVQSWRGRQSLADGAKKGYQGILSSGYYLDHMSPASLHYLVDPLSGPADSLNDAERARIQGGEACMWNEYANEETVDSRIWPRAAAVAERLWSAASVRDVDSMYERLNALSVQLDWSDNAPMLRRLTGGQPIEDLAVLADAVEATGIDTREHGGRYTSLTPLNRLVDAARPESESVRALTVAIAAYLKNPGSNADRIRGTLGLWRDNHARLLPALQRSLLLKEAMPVSEELARIGAMGLEALEYVHAGKAAPENWVAQQKAILDANEKPRIEVVLAAVRPVRMLVEAAGQR